MATYTHMFAGYPLTSEWPMVPGSFKWLILNAPIRVDGARWDELRALDPVRHELCAVMGWPLASSADIASRAAALLDEIEMAVDDARRLAVKGCDIDGAAARLLPFNRLWVGVYGLPAGETAVTEVDEYMTRRRLRGGSASGFETPEIGYITIWYDR